MRKARRKRLSRVDQLYSIFGQRDPEKGWKSCFYCGDPADTVDHHPPVSRVDDYRALGLSHEVFVKVFCCQECNCLLENSLNESLLDRERELKQKMAKKYSRKLRVPDWTEKELSCLGRTLRGEILSAIAVRDRVEKRLEYCGGINAWVRHCDM